jgi:hypothetical protein
MAQSLAAIRAVLLQALAECSMDAFLADLSTDSQSCLPNIHSQSSSLPFEDVDCVPESPVPAAHSQPADPPTLSPILESVSV